METDKEQKHQLGAKVKVSRALERGIVTGFAIYAESNAQYQVRYVTVDGTSKEGWFFGSELEADEGQGQD